MNMNMPLDTFHIEMDWPSIPPDLFDELLDYAQTAENIWEWKDVVDIGFIQNTGPVNLRKWLKDNLPIDLTDFKIRLQSSTKDVLVNHKDNLRSSSFNCVLSDDGGITHWYDDQGNKIHSFQYNQNTWYQHQGSVTHGVDNIKSPRLAITIFKFEIQPECVSQSIKSND